MRGHSADPYPQALTSAYGHAARACEAATSAPHLHSITSPQKTTRPRAAVGDSNLQWSAMEQAVERPETHWIP